MTNTRPTVVARLAGIIKRARITRQHKSCSFRRPENDGLAEERTCTAMNPFGQECGDKIKFFKGQNDWEDATTWVWAEDDEGSRVWFEVDWGDRCIDDYSMSKEEAKAARAEADKLVGAWVDAAMECHKDHVKKKGQSGYLHSSNAMDRLHDALSSPGMRDRVKSYGREALEWRPVKAAALRAMTLAGIAYTTPTSLRKQAARMVKKPRTEYDDHCPHCDHKFTEKGYPRPSSEGMSDEEYRDMIMSGDYDDLCPSCGGIVDPEDTSDEEIEAARRGWGDEVADGMAQRRDARRRRIEGREKSAASDAELIARGHGTRIGSCGHVVGRCRCNHGGRLKVQLDTPCPACAEAGIGKSAAITNVGRDAEVEEDAGPEDLRRALRKARKETDAHATEEERKAGNYRKGRFSIRGLHIAIENPANSIRAGKDGGGNPWRTVMSRDYGYFTRGGGAGAAPIAVDGDEIDVFIGPELGSDFVVAIDQYFGGKFDETKFVICCRDQAHGEAIYLSNYQPGWKLGPVSTCTLPQLREWLKGGDHKSPFKGQLVKAAGLGIIPA